MTWFKFILFVLIYKLIWYQITSNTSQNCDIQFYNVSLILVLTNTYYIFRIHRYQFQNKNLSYKCLGYKSLKNVSQNNDWAWSLCSRFEQFCFTNYQLFRHFVYSLSYIVTVGQCVDQATWTIYSSFQGTFLEVTPDTVKTQRPMATCCMDLKLKSTGTGNNKWM